MLPAMACPGSPVNQSIGQVPGSRDDFIKREIPRDDFTRRFCRCPKNHLPGTLCSMPRTPLTRNFVRKPPSATIPGTLCKCPQRHFTRDFVQMNPRSFYQGVHAKAPNVILPRTLCRRPQKAMLSGTLSRCPQVILPGTQCRYARSHFTRDSVQMPRGSFYQGLRAGAKLTNASKVFIIPQRQMRPRYS